MSVFFLSPAGDFVTHTRGQPQARVDRGTDADVSVPTGKAQPALADKSRPQLRGTEAAGEIREKDRAKPLFATMTDPDNR